jgi:hypothetical protein
VALIVVVAVVLLAAGVGGGWLVRVRAARIQQSDADRPERVHRLQRLLIATMAGCGIGVALVGGGVLAAVARHHRHDPALAAAVFGAGVVGLLVPGHGAGHVIGVAAVYVVALLLSAVVVPLLLVRLSSKPLTGDTARRLADLAGRAGVRVRGFRVLDSRGQKIANAAQGQITERSAGLLVGGGPRGGYRCLTSSKERSCPLRR